MALQMLFQQDLNPDVPADTVRELIIERLREESLARFAWSLFAGVMESRAALDARIEAIAANWSLKRMAPTDRNVLRLGAFELLYTETPARVAIDEALELAKRYGTAQSSQFVNGILDRLIPGGGKQTGEAPARSPDP
jgi:N utilization substance protein B